MSASDPMVALRQAHDAGIKKLELLSVTVSRLDSGSGQAALDALSEVLQFFDGELRVHFRHEEEALFPALQKVIGREGPIMAMLEEHKSLWRAVDAMKDKIELLDTGSTDDRLKRAREVARVADHIVGLLGSHINKEDSMIFPMAEEALSAATMQEVALQMKAVGQAA